MRPPTGNAFVSSCLEEFQFYRPLHVLVLEIPYSCFDLPVCQPAGILEGHRQLPPECACLPRDQPCFLGGAKRHTEALGTTFGETFE